MSRRVMRELLLLGACGVLSCERATGPMLEPSPDEASPARLDIVDAVHLGGNAHFFFLPPLVAEPGASGEFDGSLLQTLVVEVCVLSTNGCVNSPIARFTASGSSERERISVDSAGKFYVVHWNTGAPIVDPARNYRIRVSAAGTLLGRIDVDVVRNADALATVDRREFAGVIKGEWLAIRFRVERGTLSNTPPVVTITAPANGAHFGQGASVTFTASATDAQDGDLSAQVKWMADGTQALGTGASVGATLPVGPHLVTASVSDSRGATALASVNVTIDASPPPSWSFRITPDSLAIGPVGYGTITIQLLDNGSPANAAPGGIAIAMSSSNPACANVISPQFLAGGQSTTTAHPRWPGSTPLPCNTWVRASYPGIASDSASIRVAAASLLRFANPPVVVGSGLENGSYWVQLATPAPAGGVTVHMVSDDSTLLLLAPGFNSSMTPGSGRLDVPVPAGGSTAFFEAQGMEGRTGATWIRFTAPGYAGDSTLATVQRPAFEILALPDSMTAPGSVAFRVDVGIEWQSLNGPSLNRMRIRPGGVPVTATITNSNAAVAELLTYGAVAGQVASVTIGVGQDRSPAGGAAAHGIELRALAAGSTTVTAAIPGWFAFTGAIRTVSVTTP